MSRLDQLKQLAEAQPDDATIHYGIALEHAQLEQWDAALAAFDRAIALDGKFTAAFYHKARTEISAGRRDAARTTLDSGIDVAQATGDKHLQDKMNELLELLP